MDHHHEPDWESAYAGVRVESPLDSHLVGLAPTLDGGTAIWAEGRVDARAPYGEARSRR